MNRASPNPDPLISPKTVDELCAHIASAASAGRVLRVVGASHSVPASIAQPHDIGVSLENLRRVVDYDAERGMIVVEAGMTLGYSPAWPEAQTLSGYLEAKAQASGAGWALPELGGITHQTVGGFLSTGSQGGSTTYSLGGAIEALEFVDGRGNVHHVRRGEDLFDAVAVSMGLLGVITRVTFACDRWFDIIGRETTTHTEDCAIDLFGDGPGCLRDFLTETPYARLLWWPQQGVDKITVWQARRMEAADYLSQGVSTPSGAPGSPLDLVARPYEPIGVAGQRVAHAFYSLVGLRFGHSALDRAVQAFTQVVAPTVINAFVPTNREKPTLFWDSWKDGLPMDNSSSDTLMATDFTELWIPIDRAREVMVALRDHYRDNGLSAAGTYACEIYAAKRSPFFLSPAYGHDMVRVDIFWFAYNLGNPDTEFYPQFWQLLKRFGFRPHWGKALPDPDSDCGVDYLRAQYPCWDRFMALRDELDPEQVFVSDYWKRHLGIAARAVPRHSVTLVRGAARDEPRTGSGQSG